MEMMKNILLVPDAFTRMKSGAIVAQELSKILENLGYNVSVFSPDIDYDEKVGNVNLYHRNSYNAIANHRTSKYLEQFRFVLKQENIDAVMFAGSITNKNICYYEECFREKLKTMALIFMQDFFCMRQYANSKYSQCEKCLVNPLNVYMCKNGIDGSHLFLKKTLYLETSYKIRKIMSRLDAVIGSTYEQLDFYQKCGVMKEKCFLLPLPFDCTRINEKDSERGDYFMCIAQDRTEKGFQFIPEILKHCNLNFKIILAYNGENKAKEAIRKYSFNKYIEAGRLIVVYDKQWNTGLYDLIAKSRGVIIPSIWHTTTEYGLLEALGLKKPVFTFNISAHREFIINGVNGFKVPIGDCEALAKQLDRLYEDNDLYDKVSNGAYILYKQLTDHQSWNNFFKMIL